MHVLPCEANILRLTRLLNRGSTEQGMPYRWNSMHVSPYYSPVGHEIAILGTPFVDCLWGTAGIEVQSSYKRGGPTAHG